MPDLKVDKEMARQNARKLSLNAEPESESEKMPVLRVSSCTFVLLEHTIRERSRGKQEKV